jgi:hypothetical protein
MSQVRKYLRVGLVAIVTAGVTAVALGATAPSASAENNGVGKTPLLGWSSWSFLRQNPTAANIEAQARAMKSTGLAKAGFNYINVDDFYYPCTTSPAVDQYGRWATDTTKFPPKGNKDGIAVVADYVHKLGLKFGIYVTPGISQQAIDQNTPIKGTPYHARDIATTTKEANYNCGNMRGIDYSKPGAQAFITSWADEFASWGVDYLKIDGVGTQDVPDVQAWSSALRSSGRPIHLELSNNLAIGSASTWQKLSNGWRTGGDVECYCGPNGSSYPLTDWSNVAARFDQVADWAPYGGPGGFNDYDSLELGNGSNDGLTPDERMTQMSLWSLASSPLILGTDLTNMTVQDLRYLTNKDVLAVDQDSIDATRIAQTSTTQVFAKTEKDGNVDVGLFNTGSTPQTISTTTASLGLPASKDFLSRDLWTKKQTETTGTLSASVAPHGVALLRITPENSKQSVPPNTTVALSAPASATPGTPFTATATVADNGLNSVSNVKITLNAPTAWKVKPTAPNQFATLKTGQTATATFAVTAPASSSPIDNETLTANVRYDYNTTHLFAAASAVVSTSTPVVAPYLTYSSASDAPAQYGQSGTTFAVEGAGADLYSPVDNYTTIYQSGTVTTTSTVQTEITSQQNLSGFGKAGILVRNSMTASGTGPEGVILFESPSGGIQLEWNANSGTYIDSVTPPNGTISPVLPVYLKLVRSGSSYSGYYSADGSTWKTVGTATVAGQADSQDAGMFVTSHTSGAPALVNFSGFSVTS